MTSASGGASNASSPGFADAFREDLARLFAWRRDVRRFRSEPVPAELIDRLLDLAQLSPSVGNSQPWRWVAVESAAARSKILASFHRCNADALRSYAGSRAELYARLKLEGIEAAPVQFAVFSDDTTAQGHGLGRLTMPETVSYSAVASIMTFWLAARAAGLGVGWVSIVEPKDICRALDVPPAWTFVAYLCVGWPVEEHPEPELARNGWQMRASAGRTVLRR
jgi:5,6-dimethylbenzimidazole synthase